MSAQTQIPASPAPATSLARDGADDGWGLALVAAIALAALVYLVRRFTTRRGACGGCASGCSCPTEPGKRPEG